VLERAFSVPSLIGSLLIIITFCRARGFRKPINRLIFYATFGNIMSNVAAIMADEFLYNPTEAGCKLQAFIIQMFMPADAYWSLVMALNVYLTIYHKYDAQRLQRVEVIYLFCCYGLPFIPALTFIFINDPARGMFYGPARLWCWVTPKWVVVAMATLHCPVWVAIVITFAIYFRAGGEILRVRSSLRSLSSRSQDSHQLDDNETAFPKTAEVVVPSAVLPHFHPRAPHSSTLHRPSVSSVTVSTRARQVETYEQKYVESSKQTCDIREIENATQQGRKGRRLRAASDTDTAVWSYVKCTLLFFTALLVTWIPTTLNRLIALVNGSNLAGLEILTAIVLPLQGFFNAVIYAYTSREEFKGIWRDIRTRLPSWE
ncbi:uncharacterized protein NECHADRAFT_4204, partial [Fusarium vanettenii 77-13-4]